MTRLTAIAAFILWAVGDVAFADTPVNTLADGRTGRISFTVADRTSSLAVLVNRTYVLSDTIWGDLLMPEGVTGVVPAMVISHGSAGLQALSYAWAEMFTSMGVAAFVIDHFSGRGFGSTYSDQSQINQAVVPADGLMALRLLATHPRIDASRVGYIGFSKGGAGALISGYERMRASIIPEATRFALHVPFYPGGRKATANRLTGAPFRIFMGDLDDYDTVADTRALYEQMRAVGADVELTVYPGAYHAFDSTSAPNWVANAQTFINCTVSTNIDTLIAINTTTGARFTSTADYTAYMNACMTLGTHVGNNASARSQARQSVWSFVRQQFGLTGIPEAVTLPGDTERILNWAEWTYRSLLWNRTPMQQALGYTFRCYATNSFCVGTKDGMIYYYDGANVTAVGSVSSFLASVNADGM
jgi:dienelactone hydrolase